MMRKIAITLAAAAALATTAAAPAMADRGYTAPQPEPQQSIIEFINTWLFCEDAWLVSLDQMYPEGFSVSRCMDIIETHQGHRN